MKRRVGGTIAATATIALGLGAAEAAQAVHWPFFGGDSGRSGYQPVDEGVTPLTPTYTKAEPFVKSSIVTTTGSPATQRLIFGRNNGDINFQILGTGAPVGPEAGTNIDEGADDLDILGTRSMVPGQNGSSVSFVDTSGPTGLGQLFVAHNDDDAAAGPDIEIAQFDESSGSLVRPDVDVAGTEGFTIQSSLIATGPALDDPATAANETGNRNLLFVASNGGVQRLFKVPVTNNAATNAAALGVATGTPGDIDATPLSSPTIAFLNVGTTPTAHVAVGATDGQLKTFLVSTLAAGPAVALGGDVQTPSVPVQPSGLTPNPADPVKTAPFIYVASDTGGGATVVSQVQQNGAVLEEVGTSDALPGAPAPALATDQESEVPAPEEAKVLVTTGANLYLLSTADLDMAGKFDREDDLAPGTTGFAQTTAAGSGDYVYATNDQAQQFVLRLSDGKPVGADEFTQAADNPAAPNTGVGQPSISRGFVQYSGGNGVFVYRNTDATPPAVALTAPADGATVSGTVTLSAIASDARGITKVDFRVNGQVVGTDTAADSGVAFGAPGAVFSVAVDTTKLAIGNSVIDAVATDGGGLTATSAPRRITVQGGVDGDRPPTVAITAPAANALVRRSTTVSATAADDIGVKSVTFFDDDRVICTDTAAPYACPYTPRGDDVGRDTLFAVATDTSNQTGAAIRAIRVDRFSARSLSATVRPARDASAPFRFRVSGRLSRPSAVSAAVGCGQGMVSVRFQAGRKTISTRRVSLSSRCTYASTVTFRSRSRFTSSGRLRVRARFQGNDVLRPRAAAVRSARTR